jgi:diketogulonate reductase-like aldo/keto reductase
VVNQIEVRQYYAFCRFDLLTESQLHPYCQQRPIVEYCHKHGIVIQAYCPLIRGNFDDPVLKDVAEKVRRLFAARNSANRIH